MPKQIIKITTVNEWMTYNQKLEGVRKANVDLLREYKDIDAGLKRYAVILAFLVIKLKVEYCSTMWRSATKQRGYVWSVIRDLKKYQVEPKYERMFEQDAKLLRGRLEHIDRIIKEDLRLTDYGAFFAEAFDWSILDDMKIPETWEEVNEQKDKGMTTVIDELADIADEWNAHHTDEVARHSESIRAELEALEAHKAKLKAQREAEKLATKAKKRAEKADADEILRNRKRYRARQRRIDKSFERYYR